MHLRHRQTCRVCKSPALTKVIDLGEQFLQGSFVKPDKRMPPLRKLPTSLVRCDPMRDEKACGLLQMEYTVPPNILYSQYWYRSGTNRTMRDHLAGIVNSSLSLYGQTPGIVLDIGSNDGTLLSFYNKDIKKIGIDPSDIASNAVIENGTVIRDLFPSQELIAHLSGSKIDIITAIAMFYDLESPADFVSGIRNVLADDGLFIFEMSYMPTMLKKCMYDTICHEHLEYYSLAVVEHILRLDDMKIIRAELNDSNGGSIRCFATHGRSFKYRSDIDGLHAIREDEFNLALDTDRPYRNFQDRINIHREELNQLLWSLKREGKKIHIYGASTKGNTIMQWCGIDNRVIDYAAERNPEKFGARTLGTDIPIISEDESRAMKPDFYLVLPWHFRTEILEREAETMRRGIQLIFPLPTIEIFGQPA